MLTGIGTPTAWPFFQRRGRPSITALGGAGGSGVLSIARAGVTVAVDDLLLVGVGWYRNPTTLLPTCNIDGNALTLNVQRNTSARISGAIFSLLIAAPLVNKTITVTWTAAPTHAALIASKVNLLAGNFVEGVTVAPALTANPDSGLTADWGTDPSLHWGLVANQGDALADNLGAWQNAMQAGQRYGQALGVTIDLKEGYRFPLPSTTGRAQILGQTTRWSVPLIAYYE